MSWPDILNLLKRFRSVYDLHQEYNFLFPVLKWSQIVMKIFMEIIIKMIMETIINCHGSDHGNDPPHLCSGHQRVDKRSAADKLTWKYITCIIWKYILYTIWKYILLFIWRYIIWKYILCIIWNYIPCIIWKYIIIGWKYIIQKYDI